MCSIVKYNDMVRRALIDPMVKRLLDDKGCQFRVYITAALQHSIENQSGLIQAIAQFDHFNEQNHTSFSAFSLTRIRAHQYPHCLKVLRNLRILGNSKE